MLGNAAAARVRLIVWCKASQHQVEPDPPSKRGDTMVRPPLSIGISGWSALNAAAARLTWLCHGLDTWRAVVCTQTVRLWSIPRYLAGWLATAGSAARRGKRDSLHRSKKALFDHDVGASEQQGRQLQAELPCSYLVHDKLKFRWGLNRQFGRIGAT
jgi:hypothetical protein